MGNTHESLKGMQDKKIENKVVACCSLMSHSFICLGFFSPLLSFKTFFAIIPKKKLNSKIENGELHAFGDNNQGQFGDGETCDEYCSIPKLVTSEIRVKLVSGGREHSLIYTQDSRLLACGNNQFFQLGVKTDEQVQKTFVEVTRDQNISQICCQYYGSVILRRNGDVLVFGRNEKCQLGMDTKGENISQPTLLTNDKQIGGIHCGRSFTVIEKRNSVFLLVGKLIIEEAWLIEKPKQIEMGEKIKQIACGSEFILFLKQNGDLWFLIFLFFSVQLDNFLFSFKKGIWAR